MFFHVIDMGEEDSYLTTCGDPDPPKPLSPGTPVHGEGHVALPCSCPSSSSSGLLEGALLVQELARRHGKGHVGESRGLGGNDCPLPPLTLQTLLRNRAEPADLWGLVTKGKDLFLSDPRRDQFKLVIYLQKSISFCLTLCHTSSFLLTQKYVQGNGVTSDSHLQCVSSGWDCIVL